jgi:chromosome segregation ATPase
MNDQSHDSRDEGTTVAEASRILGISEGAVRKRVERKKLAAKHTRDGRLLVYLDRDTTTDTTRDRPRQSRDERHEDRYTRSLEEQVAYLRSQLEQERAARTEERRRQDTVIAQLSRANEEQARTIRELEAPQEPAEDAETAAAPTSELGELREELDTEQARREMAESTLHEGMAEEQRRREEAERERDDLRRELYALTEPRESPETAEEQQGRVQQPHPDAPGAPEAVQRPWWRRLFGG